MQHLADSYITNYSLDINKLKEMFEAVPYTHHDASHRMKKKWEIFAHMGNGDHGSLSAPVTNMAAQSVRGL